MQKAYWKRASSLAWTETLSLFGVGKASNVMIQLAVGLLTLLFVMLVSSKTAALDSAIDSVSVMVAIACLLPLVWISKLIRMPAKMAAEQGQKYAELEDKIRSKGETETNLQTLADFMEEGHELRKRRIDSLVQLEVHKANFLDWRNRTSGFIESQISQSSARSFSLITSVNAGSFNGEFNAEHNEMLLYLVEHIRRLQTLIDNRAV